MTSLASLDEFIQSNPDARELKRALAVKMEQKGYSHEQIGEILGVSAKFVSKWKQIFLAAGLESLRLGYKGFKPYLDIDQKQQVIQWLNEQDYYSTPELIAYINQTFGVSFKSRQSYYDLLNEAKISWKKSQPKNPKADPEQVVQKREEVKKKLHSWQPLILRLEASALFIDQCHLLWGDACGYVWGRRGERVELPISNSRQRQTYYGALDVFFGQFWIKPYPTANAEFTVRFVRYLQAQLPEERLLLIWDGATYHRQGAMLDFLHRVNGGLPKEKWPVTCIQLAPHAPEENPVEDVWLMAKTYLRQHYHLHSTFRQVNDLFVKAIRKHGYFDFPKLNEYTYSLQIN
jgi:putative transposase